MFENDLPTEVTVKYMAESESPRRDKLFKKQMKTLMSNLANSKVSTFRRKNSDWNEFFYSDVN